MIVEIILFLLTFIIGYYLYCQWRAHSHFERHGLRYLPGVPVFGNVFKNTMGRHHLSEDVDEVYKAFPDERYVGFLDGTITSLIIRDPELIKLITVKDFDHFVNHKNFSSEEQDPVLGNSLIQMKDSKWRDMRTTMSPAFTGSKMRLMVPFIIEITNNIMEYLDENASEDLDVEDLGRRYTNDVIASAAFGIQVNSLKDKDNEFYTTGQTLFDFNVWQKLSFFFISQLPASISKGLGFQIVPSKANEFFKKILVNTMEYRKKNKVERHDMIQLLMEVANGELVEGENKDSDDKRSAIGENLPKQSKMRQWTDNELIGQIFIFFFAGFDTTSSALVMCIHELALNPHVQDKLYQELMEHKKKHGEITYENINQLKYLDCVLNETLRKWAPAIFMDRTCTKAYQLPPPRENGKPYLIKPGDIIYGMVNSLHWDPQYYPNPHVFDPERFSDENKHNLRPFTYMPFGSGPRICLGLRFAVMEVKIFIYHMILKYKIMRCAKTMDPIRLTSQGFSMKAAKGTWVKFDKRE